MRKLAALLGLLVALGLTTASACQRPDPCAGLGAPTAQDLASAAAGREVEVEVAGDVECVVDPRSSRWVVSTD